MNIKKLLFIIPFFSVGAASASDLTLDIRRVGLDWSQTSVKNASDYANSPIQALHADSQDFFKGVLDSALEYTNDKLQWTNSLFAEYGRTNLEPYNAIATSSENADKILASSNLSWARWESNGFKFGPTAGGAYETEFTSGDDVPRRNLARMNAGLALFDHPIVRDLHLVGIYEYDFTYSATEISKTAAELGWRIEYEIRDGVRASTDGYYREYFSWSQYVGVDLERDLSMSVRLDTNLWGDFTMGPYVQYRLAKSRDADVYGSNFILGISFNYITKFGL